MRDQLISLLRIVAVVIVAAIGSLTIASKPAHAVPDDYLFGDTDSGTGVRQLIINGGAYVLDSNNYGWVNNNPLTFNPNNTNYFVGQCGTYCAGDVGTYNDYFNFDLSSVTGPITSATLSIYNPGTGFYGAQQAFTVHDANAVSTALLSDSNSLAGFNGISKGSILGSTYVDDSANNSNVIINLNSFALAALSALEGHSFIFGGTLSDVPLPAGAPMFAIALLAMFAAIQYGKKNNKAF